MENLTWKDQSTYSLFNDSFFTLSKELYILK